MKIKEYINKRPKLKKLLKLLAVVLALFSIGLNILVFSSLAVSCNQNNKVEKNVLVTTPVKHAFKSGRWIIGTNSDFMSMQFIDGFVSNNPSFFYNNDKIGLYFEVDCHGFKVSIDDFDFDDPSSSGNITYVEHLRIYCTTVGNIQGGVSRYYSYSYYMYDSNYNSVANYDFVLVPRTYNNGYTYEGYMDIIYSIPNSYVYIFDRDDTRNENITEWLLPLANQNTYTAGYGAGYVAGKDDGYRQGFQVGESKGYTDGLNDRDSSPFGLINSAFSSIASILNIQVLPNITIATLVFTPLIIVLVIVIVKIFRG